MTAVNELAAETAGNTVISTGDRRPKAAEDEDDVTTGQGPVAASGGRSRGSFARLAKTNTEFQEENANLRQEIDAYLEGPDESKSACRKVIVWSVGAMCCLVAVVAIFSALLMGLTGGCNIYEKALCTKNNATCSKRWFTSTCQCNVIGHEFYKNICQYKCDYDSRGFCPNGICYKSHCFPDVFAFVTFIYNERCKETATDAVCSVTCAEVVKFVCAHSSSNPLFCKDSKPTTLTDFSCQRGNVSKGFIELTSDREKECIKDQHCKRLMTLYPCLAGYVNRGSVFCSKKCVVPQNREGEPLFFNGYCFLKNANCGGAMTKLMDVLNGSEIGYPYTAEHFHTFRVWVQHNLKIFPNVLRLLYPLMLAYGVLGEEGKVSTKNDAPETGSEFSEALKDKKVQTLLKSLYTANPNIVQDLMKRVKQKINADVYEDRFLRVAYLDIYGHCRTFNECPNITTRSLVAEKIDNWAEEGGIYCSLSRALFITNITVNATWCESIARLQGAAQLSTKSFSFIYSPSFVSNLISQTSYVIKARRLDDDVFNRSRALCDIEENVNDINRSNTIIPMALSDALGWVKNERTKPKRISGFALILANAVSVKKVICNEEDHVPSIHCELRLYLAFRSFLPEPCKEEKKLIPSGDKAVVYFTLRAAMRRQLSRESENPHVKKTQRFPANHTAIVEAAQQLVAQCLEGTPD